MATVNKNFRIKNGLVVEGSTATVNGNNILTENGGDQYILNLIGGETLVKSVSSDFTVTGGGQLQVNNSSDLARTGDITSAINALDTDDIEEGSSNQYFTTSRARDAFNAGSYIGITNGTIDVNVAQGGGLGAAQGYLAIDRTTVDTWYDAAGAAATAQSNAEDYADGLAPNYDAAGAANTAYTNAVADANDYTDSAITALNLGSTYDAYGAASQALIDANDYTDGEISTALTTAAGYATTAENNAKSYADGLASNYDAAGSATTALNDAKAYTDQEVAALVDSAPALLDTLNELAAAIADNPNYASDVAGMIADKQNNLTAGTGITLSNDVISVTANTYDAYGSAADAQSNAEDYADTVAGTAETNAKNYADGLASNYDPAGSAATAESNAASYTDSAISSGNSSATPSYSAIQLGGYTKQVGNWVAASTASSQVTAFSYPASTYGSAEFLVRVMSNSAGHLHSQLSKILVTTDAAGNVAITEYGIVTTNGSMGDVTADIAGGNVRILVTPEYDSSEVIVSGSLLAYND